MKTLKASLLPIAILIHIGTRLLMTDSYLDSFETQDHFVESALELPLEMEQTVPTLQHRLSGMEERKLEESYPIASLQ